MQGPPMEQKTRRDPAGPQGSPKERSSSLANSRIKESLEGSKDKTIELALVPE